MELSKGQTRDLDKWKAMFLCDLDNNTIVKKSLGLTLKPEPTLEEEEEEEEESNQEAPSSSTALQERTPAKEEHQTPKGKRYLWDPAKETCVCIHPSGLVEQANELVDMGGKVAAIFYRHCHWGKVPPLH